MIAVIGGSNCCQKYEEMAQEVGMEIAKCGAILVCGGLDGVMQAACKGATEAGGLTVGILPGDDREAANEYVQIPILTGMGYARNAIVARCAQSAIAIDGSYGTLSEIGHALQFKIPVIGLHTWSFSVDGKKDKSIIQAHDPKDAVEKAIAAAKP